MFSFYSFSHSSTIGPSEAAGVVYFHIDKLQYLASNTGFFLALAILPLLLAPLSESVGRRPVFLASAAVYTTTFALTCTIKNYTVWAIIRTMAGAAASVANSMSAGTVADLYRSEDRGLAMNFFALSVYISQSAGPAVAGWASSYLDYRWLWGVSHMPKHI
jgi:MFS family permease